MLDHGGALRAASRHYGIALGEWLDLSTGINPQGYPVPTVPAAVWRRLPELDDGLEQAAAEYYSTGQVLPVAGSQAAIQTLPALRALLSRVGVLNPGYAEHARAWQRQGHRVELLSAQALAEAADRLDVLVVINPSNPTGERFAAADLLGWRARLAARGGWLVVDEAFMDVTPEQSLTSFAGLPGLIVLRSLGKFFGLAGARVGFVLGETTLRERLQEQLGPWAVSGPGRWIATRALADLAWQRQARLDLLGSGVRLAELLRQCGLTVAGGTALFQWVTGVDAERVQNALARRGIWVRRFADPPSLRLGLPGGEADWQRLERALAEAGAGRRG